MHLSSRHERLSVRPRRRGRDLLVPVGADPAHDLNLLWAHLRAPSRGSGPHVVAFGGDLPVLAGPVLAAWLGVPLVTLLRGNDFDAAVFNPRRRPALDAAVHASAAVACVTRDMAAARRRAVAGHAGRGDRQRDRPHAVRGRRPPTASALPAGACPAACTSA